MGDKDQCRQICFQLVAPASFAADARVIARDPGFIGNGVAKSYFGVCRRVPVGLVIKQNSKSAALSFTEMCSHHAGNLRHALCHSTLRAYSTRLARAIEDFCNSILQLRAIVRELAHHLADDAIGVALGRRSHGLDQAHRGNISFMVCPALRSNICSISSRDKIGFFGLIGSGRFMSPPVAMTYFVPP